jgi:hypothetical protein
MEIHMDGSMPTDFHASAARPIKELEAEITQLAGHMNAANHRWLTLIAEFDNRKGWSDWGTQSCAHWLNWKCGIALGAAREKVRVAHALEKLPKISASMAKGELSYSKVRELTRVASTVTEDCLLMVALNGSAHHVETLVRGYRRAIEAQELSREERQQSSRSVTFHYDDDGSLIVNARLPAEVGAVFVKALDVGMEELSTDVPAGTSETHEKKLTRSIKRADALAIIAESFLQHGAEAMNGGDKYQVVVHVSEESLSSVRAEPVEALWSDCRFDDGVAIANESAHRLSCDCSVVRMTEDEEGNPLNVGRKTRSIPPALKRALNSRDQGCRFPGCTNKRYTHGHHVDHWANGGETKLGNLVTLCYFHHRLVHEGGWVIQVLNDGAFRFLRPNGESFGDYSPTSGERQKLLSFLPATSHQSLVTPAQWRGDKMDYGLAVQVLFQQERRSWGVSH